MKATWVSDDLVHPLADDKQQDILRACRRNDCSGSAQYTAEHRRIRNRVICRGGYIRIVEAPAGYVA